jgi:hypothetical protein
MPQSMPRVGAFGPRYESVSRWEVFLLGQDYSRDASSLDLPIATICCSIQSGGSSEFPRHFVRNPIFVILSEAKNQLLGGNNRFFASLRMTILRRSE